jgi:hypothetical protein
MRAAGIRRRSLGAGRFSRRWLLLPFALLAALGAVGFKQSDVHGDDVANLSRSVIGDERTARLEGLYFSAKDHSDRLKYSVFGGDTSTPFDESHVLSIPVELSAEESAAMVSMLQRVDPAPPPPRPAPLALPEVVALNKTPAAGEGSWTTAGLPRSNPDDVLMAKTFVRPDPSRPYATVGVLLFDKRRIRLHVVGGRSDPGGDLGIKGPGMIPEADRRELLAAWNGGFRGPHGGFGMVADGLTYRPLRKGLASVAVMKDGTIRMGEWGRDLGWTDETAAVRQNAVLLVDNCEVSRRTNEGNDTWGYVEVNSAQFITWRSAIGLTQDGNLMVASGNSLSAATLAKALQAAGACYAMQLDINPPYVLTSLFFAREDGSVSSQRFMDTMSDNPSRFLSLQQRDFMYVTLDETRFVPEAP